MNSEVRFARETKPSIVRKKLKKIEMLSEKEKEVVKDLLKYYKKALRCKKCKKFFGFDGVISNKCCPLCTDKIR